MPTAAPSAQQVAHKDEGKAAKAEGKAASADQENVPTQGNQAQQKGPVKKGRLPNASSLVHVTEGGCGLRSGRDPRSGSARTSCEKVIVLWLRAGVSLERVSTPRA